jgi:hypothetical protein
LRKTYPNSTIAWACASQPRELRGHRRPPLPCDVDVPAVRQENEERPAGRGHAEASSSRARRANDVRGNRRGLREDDSTHRVDGSRRQNGGRVMRRTMRRFSIEEISGVDKPAQQHARALIMKRDENIGAAVAPFILRTAEHARPCAESEIGGHDDQETRPSHRR